MNPRVQIHVPVDRQHAIPTGPLEAVEQNLPLLFQPRLPPLQVHRAQEPHTLQRLVRSRTWWSSSSFLQRTSGQTRHEKRPFKTPLFAVPQQRRQVDTPQLGLGMNMPASLPGAAARPAPRPVPNLAHGGRGYDRRLLQQRRSGQNGLRREQPTPHGRKHEHPKRRVARELEHPTIHHRHPLLYTFTAFERSTFLCLTFHSAQFTPSPVPPQAYTDVCSTTRPAGVDDVPPAAHESLW